MRHDLVSNLREIQTGHLLPPFSLFQVTIWMLHSFSVVSDVYCMMINSTTAYFQTVTYITSWALGRCTITFHLNSLNAFPLPPWIELIPPVETINLVYNTENTNLTMRDFMGRPCYFSYNRSGTVIIEFNCQLKWIATKSWSLSTNQFRIQNVCYRQCFAGILL